MRGSEIKKLVTTHSERVKSISFHSKRPWILVSLYSGSLQIYERSTGQIVKSFEVSIFPVRCARFVERKDWVICGADNMEIR
jgi:coatomer subunit beta'